MSQPMSKAEKKAVKKTAAGELRDTIIVIIEALVIAVLFRTFLYQPFSIPTASMQSTLMIGDYFVADKFIWGYGKYSFPFADLVEKAGIDLPSGRLFGRDPARGDIAVFRNEIADEDYIKTVIGMPGDTIQMRKGRLWIKEAGKDEFVMVEREEIARSTDTDSYGQTVPVVVYKETLPNGVTHTIQEISDEGPLDNTGEYPVPPGHFFMMGDNRDRSQDSRVLSAVGYVPSHWLIGKASARFFSIKDNIAPWMLWEWPANVRWNRMFQSVYP
jgi:signal peptidase I